MKISVKLNHRLLKLMNAMLCAVVGFLISALLIHFLLPNPLRLYAEYRSEKLSILDAERGKVTSGTFGSSHVHNGFDPRIFDAELVATPWKTRSINLAIEGGSQTEQRVMAKAFLESMPVESSNKTCLILLELNAGANFAPRHFLHPRTINIYDLGTVLFALHLVDKQQSLGSRLGRLGFPISAGLMHYVNVGMLSSLVFQPNKINEELLVRQTLDDRRGLLSEPYSKKEASDVHEGLSHHVNNDKHEIGLVDGNSRLLFDLGDVKSNCHQRYFYFVTPKVSDVNGYYDYPAELNGPDGMVPIFNFARPDLYPELYQQQLWHDPTHLNDSGAKVFTRLLARQVLNSLYHQSKLTQK